MGHPKTVRFNLSILWRLIIYIVICSTLITILLSALHLLLTYQNEISIINGQFEEIKAVYLDPIKTSLWVMDMNGLTALVGRLSELNYVQRVALSDNAETILEVGKNEMTDTLSRTYPLAYEIRNKS